MSPGRLAWEIGDMVRVHRPAFRDASGCAYGEGKHHGATGRVTFADGPRVGSDYLCDIEIDGRNVSLWASDLLPV